MNKVDAIILNQHFVWTNEFDFSPVRQNQSYAVSGALVIQAGVKQAGRPIHLAGILSRAQVKALKALAAIPAAHVLTFNSTNYNVRWDYEKTEISAKARIGYADPDDSDYYDVVLRFLEV